MAESIATSGFVKPGFEAVREPFVKNFKHRNELGAACCIYYRVEKLLTYGAAAYGTRQEACREMLERLTFAFIVCYRRSRALFFSDKDS